MSVKDAGVLHLHVFKGRHIFNKVLPSVRKCQMHQSLNGEKVRIFFFELSYHCVDVSFNAGIIFRV